MFSEKLLSLLPSRTPDVNEAPGGQAKADFELELQRLYALKALIEGELQRRERTRQRLAS
jgi:hypothetical protein